MSLLTVIALLSLCASIEDIRGHHAWTATVRLHIDRGDPLDVIPPPPPPIPVAQNFFGHPTLARLYFAKSTNSEIAALARAVPIADRGIAWKWTSGEPLDLATICALIAEQHPQMKLPAHFGEEPPATRLLAYLGGANHLLSELRHAALYRPQSQPVRASPTRLENVFKTEMPSFRFARVTTQSLSLHACASLASGDAKTAFADTLAGLQFSRGVAASSDTLVEAMIAAVVVKVALQPLWEGVRTHTWSEPQLARFQTVLAAIDLLSAFRRGTIVERNGILALFPARIAVVPDAWIQHNRVYFTQRYTEEIDSISTHTSPAFLSHLTAAEAREKNIGSSSAVHPYRIFTNQALPALTKITRNVAFSASAITLALTACALERHYLAHGAYPESLDKLVPAYLTTVPLDIINGDPLRYRLNPDGTFTLYSIGLDGDDDNGHRTPSGSNDLTTDGDWAW